MTNISSPKYVLNFFISTHMVHLTDYQIIWYEITVSKFGAKNFDTE